MNILSYLTLSILMWTGTAASAQVHIDNTFAADITADLIPTSSAKAETPIKSYHVSSVSVLRDDCLVHFLLTTDLGLLHASAYDYLSNPFREVHSIQFFDSFALDHGILGENAMTKSNDIYFYHFANLANIGAYRELDGSVIENKDEHLVARDDISRSVNPFAEFFVLNPKNRNWKAGHSPDIQNRMNEFSRKMQAVLAGKVVKLNIYADKSISIDIE